MHVGGLSVSEVVNFARNSVWAPNLETLNPNTFPDCLNDGHPWVVDFYAPWCPPCMRLIPEFRRVSILRRIFAILERVIYLFHLHSRPAVL